MLCTFALCALLPGVPCCSDGVMLWRCYGCTSLARVHPAAPGAVSRKQSSQGNISHGCCKREAAGVLHAQALACLMFTAGKVGHQLAPEAAEAARTRVLQLQDSFSPLDVSATLQGFAALEIDAPEVFRALMDRVSVQLGGFCAGITCAQRAGINSRCIVEFSVHSRLRRWRLMRPRSSVRSWTG